MSEVTLWLSRADAETLKLYILEHNAHPAMKEMLKNVTAQLNRLWDANRNQQEKCLCTHSYERHFDSYEDMMPVGCKYCECYTFIEA